MLFKQLEDFLLIYMRIGDLDTVNMLERRGDKINESYLIYEDRIS